jgi:hypothetical protein
MVSDEGLHSKNAQVTFPAGLPWVYYSYHLAIWCPKFDRNRSGLLSERKGYNYTNQLMFS